MSQNTAPRVLYVDDEAINQCIATEILLALGAVADTASDGLQALQWWKEGNIAAIAAYCRKDVEITRDIYLFGHREGYLLFTNKAGQAVRVAVEW